MVDGSSLMREFELVRSCDAIHKSRDINELKQVCVGLLKLNHGLRDYIRAMVEKEIPITDKMPER